MEHLNLIIIKSIPKKEGMHLGVAAQLGDTKKEVIVWELSYASTNTIMAHRISKSWFSLKPIVALDFHKARLLHLTIT